MAGWWVVGWGAAAVAAAVAAALAAVVARTCARLRGARAAAYEAERRHNAACESVAAAAELIAGYRYAELKPYAERGGDGGMAEPLSRIAAAV
eukprot:gene11431-57924_t